MGNIIYNTIIHFYSISIWFASFFNEKAKKMVTGREDIFQNLQVQFSKNTKPVAWFHCASLGEFEQGRPVIEFFGKEYPDYLILLTFFSSSGFEVRQHYDKAHIISYLPMDTIVNAEDFLKITKPKIAIFVKYEFWNNYLTFLQLNNIPTFLISANFRPDQLFFKPYGRFFRNILEKFSHIFVQNEASKNLLNSINYQNVTVAGDTRFDRVFELGQKYARLEKIEKFKGNNKLFVVGSAWPEDFDFLLPIFCEPVFQTKFIIAPHEINEKNILEWQTRLKVKSIRYSEIGKNTSLEIEAKILIIDNIGLLSSIYNYADICWIGGAFGKGLHNILEAATFGKPIFFGNKNYQKFQEAMDLINLEGAFAINEIAEIKSKLAILSTDLELYNKTCNINSHYIQQHIGATNRIMNKIKKVLENDIK